MCAPSTATLVSEYRLPTCHSPGPVDSRDWAWFLWVSQGLAHGGWWEDWTAGQQAGVLRAQM